MRTGWRPGVTARRLGLGLVLCLVASGCTAPDTPGPAPLAALTSCHSGTDSTSSAVLYASDFGFFRKHGLDVTLVYANGGAASVATLLSGQAQICQMSGANVVSAARAGEDLVVVAGLVNTTPFTLIAAPSLGGARGLAGQTVASPAGGGAYELGLRLHLASHGISFEQVRFAPLGSQPAVIAAMEAGHVGAALQVPPESSLLLSRGFVEVPFGNSLPPAFQHIALVTRKAYLQANRPAVTAYVRAVAEAIAAMKGDEAGFIAVAAKHRKLDPVAQHDDLVVAHREIVVGRMEAVPAPTLAGMDYIVRNTPAAPGARAITAADLIDGSVVEDLVRTGAIGTARP